MTLAGTPGSNDVGSLCKQQGNPAVCTVRGYE